MKYCEEHLQDRDVITDKASVKTPLKESAVVSSFKPQRHQKEAAGDSGYFVMAMCFSLGLFVENLR